MITKNELLRLTGVQDTNCVSLFIPAHRTGQETLKGQDSINLKNQVKEVKNKLDRQGVKGKEQEALLKPVTDLIKDNDFWRHQSDGLAVFLSESVFEKYVLPIRFEAFNYVSNEFYILPLMPLFNGNTKFLFLVLQKSGVNFYEGNKYEMAERIIPGLPSRLEDTVGYDYQQDSLQFRTSSGGVSFHGHGEGDSRLKNEVLRFFRSIDKAVMAELNKDQRTPLVLCCVDYYFPIYQEANTYKNLYPEHISSNFSEENLISLHKKVSDLLESYFNQNYPTKLNLFLETYEKGRASSDIEDILPATFQGRVDTLFIEKGADIYGIYDPSVQKLRIEEEQKEPHVSLMNLAAKKVFEQGGAVYLSEKSFMPDGSSVINALYRY